MTTNRYEFTAGEPGRLPVRNGVVLLSHWEDGGVVRTGAFRAEDMKAVIVDWEHTGNRVVVIVVTPYAEYVIDFTDVIKEEDDGGMCVVECSEALELLLVGTP